MERELRLQKSLSEECEDLGVDEPSTSDLFPEADLLFDNNQSPSFEQITPKRAILLPEINKEESKLFSGDDSSSVGANLLFEPIEYASPDTVFEYGPPNQVFSWHLNCVYLVTVVRLFFFRPSRLVTDKVAPATIRVPLAKITPCYTIVRRCLI